MNSPKATAIEPIRVRVFVDFWNFALSIRGQKKDFLIDWRSVGPLFAQEAGKLIDANSPTKFEGMHVYGSFDPAKPQDAKLSNWFRNTLDKMPGVKVTLLERQKKRNYPKCPACQAEVKYCPACKADMRGTEEKGVDTRMVTDMISLAWEDAYDAAVLVSSDRDFVPVAEFLQTKGIKVVHGAFPPLGTHVSQASWGNIKIPDLMTSFERKAEKKA
jgi:uncharacterized LabA/DUF88 family protein